MIHLLLQIAIIVALTLLNSLFAMSETALVSSRKERLKRRAEASERRARETENPESKGDRYE
jgi:magnesium and cobalt exporter, CNNM family